MNHSVQINCVKCRTITSVPIIQFATHFNKSANVVCRNCKNRTQVNVTMEFLSGKNPEVPSSTTLVKKNAKEIYSKSANAIVQINLSLTSAKQQLKLTDGENILGRKSNSTEHPNKRSIQTSDNKISRNHFRIVVETKLKSRCFWIEDLNSLNGTFVNGKKLDTNDIISLFNGDIIDIGENRLVFSVTEQ